MAADGVAIGVEAEAEEGVVVGTRIRMRWSLSAG